MAEAQKNRKWMVLRQPDDFPVLDKDIKMEVGEKPALEDNQLLVRIEFASLDPFLRGTMNAQTYAHIPAVYPRVLGCFAAGEVVESTCAKYPVGTKVSGFFSMQDYHVVRDADKAAVNVVPPELSLSLSVGLFGMPGATAYFGTVEILQPKEGETLVVTAAAGAVGSVVGQIAKLKGARVVGFAGGKEKCEFVKSLGFDECIDYKGKTAEQLTEELRAAAPKGVDMFFENTGGPASDAVFNVVNTFARVAVCGVISLYNLSKEELAAQKGTSMLLTILRKQLTVRGFMVGNFKDWSVAFKELGQWQKEGKIKVKEDIREGMENMFEAWMSLYRTSDSNVNFGKLVLKL